MMELFRRLWKMIEVPSLDPDESRRARLLNILLLGLLPLVILMIIVLLFDIAFKLPGWEMLYPTLWTCIAYSISTLLIVRLNRAGKIRFASILFLIMLAISIATANINLLVAGESMFYFVVPVMVSSVLLTPSASFVTALSIGAMISVIGFLYNVSAGFYLSTFPLLAIALVSWLTARSLENALTDLRLINQELDARVIRRTQELAQANQQLGAQAYELAQANLQLAQQADDLSNANACLERQTQELSSANEKLKSLDRLKSKFVSDVTHELRTPISNLTIYMEMLRLGKAERQERYIKVLEEEINRLAQLVQDVLDLTRMELGTRKTEFHWIDFNQVIDQVFIANHLRAEVKGLKMAFEPAAYMPPLWADASQLKQVATNLIGNAVNYTPKGEIKIRTLYDAGQKHAVLQVEDTGMGIHVEDLPHIFERFYRGAQASQSSIPGTGLGLSITKEIVETHKGRIEIASQLGSGSTFTIFLPVMDGDQANGAEAVGGGE